MHANRFGSPHRAASGARDCRICTIGATLATLLVAAPADALVWPLCSSAPLNNLIADSLSCAQPDATGYLPSLGPLAVECTVEFTLDSLPVCFASFDITFSIVAVQPSGVPFVSGSEVEARALQNVRFSTFGGDGAYSRTASVTLTDVDTAGAEMASWFISHVAAGRRFAMRATLDAANTFAEPGEVSPDNTLTSGALAEFTLVPLSGKLMYGAATATLIGGNANRWKFGGPGCPFGQLTLSEGASAAWIAGAGFTSPPLNVSGHCATLGAVDSSGASLVALTSTTNFSVTGPLGGLSSDITVELGPLGAKAISGSLTLPAGHTHHKSVGGVPVARGHRKLKFSHLGFDGAAGYGASMSAFRGRLPTGYLQARALPFALKLIEFTAQATTVRGRHNGAHYHHHRAFAPDDPRAPAALGEAPRLVSNDMRWAHPSAVQSQRQFTLRPEGLSSRIDFNEVAGSAHFPYLWMSTAASSLQLAGGKIRAGQSIGPDTAFDFSLDPSCALCANPGGPHVEYSLNPVGPTGLAPDGTTATRVDNLAEAALGAWQSGQGHIVERQGDTTKSGHLMVPGFEAIGTGGISDAPVSAFLLGSRALSGPPDAPLPGAHHLTQGTQARSGNHFFAGLTVGPEVYAGSSGVPSVGRGENLAGTKTLLRLGGHAAGGACSGGPCEVVANVGTKYVARSEGLTGVFNTNTPPEPEIYGYSLPLERFAFRAVANAIDTTTWMDGTVSIPSPGDFDIAFTSLSFDCAGALGSAVVPDCPAGSPPTNPNCGERLGAWQTAFEPLSLAFTPDGTTTSACLPGDRLLEVGKSLQLSALQAPLGLTAKWYPNGEPGEATVTGQSCHRLDQPNDPQTPADEVALDLCFAGPIELARNATVGGTFIASASVLAPFWDAFAASVRLAQQSSTTAGPTVLVNSPSPIDLAALLPEDSAAAMADDDAALRARYTWGATGMKLDFPVAYQGNSGGAKAPQMIGLTRAFSLVVLELEAAVDYVKPSGTKISFGASADLSARALAEVDLHIDLRDPASLAAIDAWLNGFGISGTPITNAVGALTWQITTALDVFADLQLDAMLRSAISAALDVALAGVPGIPSGYSGALDYLASAVASLEAVPGRLAAEVSLEFESTLELLLAPLTAELNLVVLDVYAEASLALASKSCGGTCDTLLNKIEDIRSALTSVISALDQAMALLEMVPDRTEALLGEAELTVNTALSVLGVIAASTTGSAGFSAQFNSASVSGNTLVLALLVVLFPTLEPLLEGLEMFDVADDIAELAELIPLDLGGLGGAETDIRNQAAALFEELLDAAAAFELGIGAIDFSMSLSGMAAIFVELEQELEDTRAAIGAVRADLELPVDDLQQALKDARAVVAGADAMLAALARELECLSTAGCVLSIEVSAAIDAKLELDAWMQLFTGGALSFGASGGFAAVLVDELRLPIDSVVATVAVAVNAALPQLSAFAAFADPVTLKTALVDAIMASAAVEALLGHVQECFALLVESAIDLSAMALDQVQRILEDAVASVEMALSAALNTAQATITGVVPDLPFDAARIDGYAVINSTELERLHISANFSRAAANEESESVFEAALDVKSWDTNGSGDACTGGTSGAFFDVVISTANVPLRLGPNTVSIDTAHLGFTLDGKSFPPSVKGVFGGITTSGGLDFEAFSLFDIGLEMGVGAYETYLGAKASATFGSINLASAFLAGRTCGYEVLEKLDPQVAEFITLPGGVFNGGYVRGSASFPVVDFGCLLRLELLADLGAWILAGPPLTIGGLVGGGASGKLGCIGALRGQVTLFGEKSGNNMKYAGEGFAAAGAGLDCDPHTWTTVARSRQDDWCGTGDATIRASYENRKFSVDKPSVSAVH